MDVVKSVYSMYTPRSYVIVVEFTVPCGSRPKSRGSLSAGSAVPCVPPDLAHNPFVNQRKHHNRRVSPITPPKMDATSPLFFSPLRKE